MDGPLIVTIKTRGETGKEIFATAGDVCPKGFLRGITGRRVGSQSGDFAMIKRKARSRENVGGIMADNRTKIPKGSQEVRGAGGLGGGGILKGRALGRIERGESLPKTLRGRGEEKCGLYCENGPFKSSRKRIRENMVRTQYGKRVRT